MNSPLNLSVVVISLAFFSLRISVEGSEQIDCSSSRSRPCVSLCCDWGEPTWAGSCVKFNETGEILAQGVIEFFNDSDGIVKVISKKDYNMFENDPCHIGWMASSVVQSFNVDENGSVTASDFDEGLPSTFDEYCLFRHPETTRYSAKICRPWVRKGYWEIFCVVFAITVMLAIFIGHTAVPELRNLHGLIVRCYTATYIGVYIGALAVLFTTELRTYPFWFSFFETWARYCGASCAFWLNVMGFNIWRSFRNLRPVYHHCNHQKRSIIYYAMFAWCTPAIIFAIAAALMFYVPYFRDDIVGMALKQWGSVGLVTIALCCNALFHTSTALKIRNFKQTTSDLIDGVNRHREAEKKWFNLYLKLFVIMGGHIIIWPIFLVWPTPTALHVLAAFEAAQSVMFFMIFFWKGNIKRTLHTLFILSSVMLKVIPKRTEASG